jgi:hypothetical protein
MDADEIRSRLRAGKPVDLRTGDPDQDDPARAQEWESDREIPAEVLVALLTSEVSGSADGRWLDVAGARIVGAVDLRLATLTRGLVLRECALVERLVLRDATVLTLELPGSHVPGIDAENMRSRGNVELSDGFTATGEVNLLGAHIGGQLDCTEGTFRNPGGTAINADTLTIVSGMFCRGGFTADGEVNLLGAHIGGQLVCSEGTFRNPSGRSISAARLTIDQDVFCDDGFTADGEVNLLGAHIGGQLVCSEGTFRNPSGRAISADGLTVDGGMFCRGGFTADGDVRLLGAHIGGQLVCSEGTFRNPAGTAINAAGLTVDQDMFCDDGFTADGEVNLLGAHIGGQLACSGGTFRNPGGLALSLELAEIRGNVFMRPVAFDGALDLTMAQVRGWGDDATTWPNIIGLDGFIYTAIKADPPVTVADRLRWLRRRDPDEYLPQPYEQLANIYRREGHDDWARQVLIAKQRHRRASHPSRRRRWPALAWSTLLRTTVGYGHRPWLALWPAALLFATGWLVFTADHNKHLIVPSTDRTPVPTFNAARYTADLLLPVANLGERAKFTAISNAAWHAFGYTLAGWLLAVILVAGLTGIFKRD